MFDRDAEMGTKCGGIDHAELVAFYVYRKCVRLFWVGRHYADRLIVRVEQKLDRRWFAQDPERMQVQQKCLVPV